MTPIAPPEIVVRHALPADAERIQALYAGLVANPGIRVLPEVISALSDHVHGALLVCTISSTVCATALVSLCADVMFGNQPFAVVENVVVDPEYRGQGIGTKLFSFIEDFCRTRECSKIMLLSAASRSEAHRFFERAGYDSQAKRGFVKYRRHFAQVT